MRRPQVGVKAQVKMGAVVPSNAVLQMIERHEMGLKLYRTELECLWEANRHACAKYGHIQSEMTLRECAKVQKRHERIMAAAVQTFDLMTWGRETGLQAI